MKAKFIKKGKQKFFSYKKRPLTPLRRPPRLQGKVQKKGVTPHKK